MGFAASVANSIRLEDFNLIGGNIMSYVIVKGKSKKALNDFEFNGLPIKANVTRWQMIENPESCYSDRLFHFYNDCASIYRTIKEAEDYISLIKRQIEENRNRYESCIKGSTDKLMKFANQLRVIDSEESNFKHDEMFVAI